MATLKNNFDCIGISNTNCMKIFNKVTLPDHLVVDNILTRLPIKSLTRFKSVSRFWLSSISSPVFAKSWLCFSSPSHQLLFLARRRSNAFFLLSNDDEFDNITDPVMIDKNPAYRLNRGYFDLVGCSNGLVCVNNVHYYPMLFNTLDASRISSDFYICNPATRQYHKIPNPKSLKLASLKDQFWFGYVPCNDDYKIVAAFHPYPLKHGYDEFYLFSLNTGKWRRMKDLDKLQFSPYGLHRGTKVIDNILFFSFVEGETMPPVFGFDLINEKLKEFPSLDRLKFSRVYEYYNIHFLDINGCLGLIYGQTWGSNICEIWTLKQHDNWTWEKLYAFHGHMDLCHVTSTGKYVTWTYSKTMFNNQYPREFKIIDPSKDKNTEINSQWSIFVDYSFTGIRVAVDYVESLTSPFGNPSAK